MQKQIFKPMVYPVPSKTDQNKEYILTNYRPGYWRCSCRDYAFRSRTPDGYAKEPCYFCKHIKEKRKELGLDE
jgi:predicted SprT family Zn-dependent metalloprotease